MASGQRTAKSGGRPGAEGQDAQTQSQTCLDLVGEPVAQPPVQASPEASLEIQCAQAAGRPCYEAADSACRGEWRREAGSPARARLMPVRERESGELPSPICPGLTARLDRDLLFLVPQAPTGREPSGRKAHFNRVECFKHKRRGFISAPLLFLPFQRFMPLYFAGSAAAPAASLP